jgi:coproporphyrinogen III oxidase-like Fe-S oxidoreductase
VGLGPSAATYTGDAFYFNTFSVREYIEAARERLPIALKMQVSHRLEKLFWLYWRLYEIEVPKREYQELFKADFPWDFELLLRLLELLGFGRKEFGDRFVLSSRGAHWIHLLQNQYALNYVNTIWSICQVIPWPNKVRL